jgi:leucyl aminopeptidase (aminopeptidase T)
MAPQSELFRAARIALQDCLRVQPHETVLVLTDATCATIGQALLAAARDLGVYAVYTEIPVLERNGQDPPRPIRELMKSFQVVVAPTEKSLTHTDARREACLAGARVATMPGIQEETMIRCLNADYYAIADRTERVTRILSQGNDVRVTTAAGTDLRFSISGIQAIASTGLIHSAGGFGNLPSGEAYLRPLEGTSEGVLVVDGSMASIGNLLETGETIRIEIAGGLARSITGGDAARRLDGMLGAVGPAAYTVAEFGVGTNDAAKIIGNILEDEKVQGTIHVAFGNNVSMGGKCNVPIHLDGIVRDPTVELDGKLLMEDGRLLLDQF